MKDEVVFGQLEWNKTGEYFYGSSKKEIVNSEKHLHLLGTI